MNKLRKKTLQISGLLLLVISFWACSNDDAAKLEEKWQMRQTIHSGGQIEPVDSIFYNFMKGTFSAICLTKGGNYAYYSGRYSFEEGRIKVTLIDNDAEQLASDQNTVARHMHWTGNYKEFQLSALEGSSLRLISDEYTYVFRKY